MLVVVGQSVNGGNAARQLVLDELGYLPFGREFDLMMLHKLPQRSIASA